VKLNRAKSWRGDKESELRGDKKANKVEKAVGRIERGREREREKVYTCIEMYLCICIPTVREREREREREEPPRCHGDRIDPRGSRRYVRNDSQLANSILAR